MKHLSKSLVFAVALLAAGMLSSSVWANNDLLFGSFTLSQPIQWRNSTLPAGTYTVKLSRTQTNTNLLRVEGNHKTLDVLVFAQSACNSCKSGAINLENGTRVVSSIELPGYHVNFTPSGSAAQREQEMAKKSGAASQSEQVAIHVNNSN